MRIKIYIVLLALMLAIVSLSCGNSPTGSESVRPTSSLKVVVNDTAGFPVPGLQVKTFPETITLITNDEGIVVFDKLKPDDYQVVVSRSDIPVFYDKIRVTNQPAIMPFTIAIEVTVNLSITHEGGIPIENAKISTSPPTIIVTTNDTGSALMERIPVKRYTFIIEREHSTAYVFDKYIIAKNGIVQDLNLVLQEQDPHVDIIAPTNNLYQSIFGLNFIGEGIDFEDGTLPDDAFVWSSDIDGEIGVGKEIFVDRMSIGHHTITLTGFDSSGRSHFNSVEIALFFYAKDSFFPIPDIGTWAYSNTPVSFEGIFMEEYGRFDLGDVQVRMDDVNVRTSDMHYIFTSYESGDSYLVENTVSDYLDNDIDELYVTKTIQSISYRNAKFEHATPKEISLETVYREKYPLIQNHLDISDGNDFSYSSRADVTWTFPGVVYGSSQFKEEMDIRSETTFEGYETITTPAGTFDAAKLKVAQDDAERTWWMVKGYGIVKYSHNTFGTDVIVSLTDTNLDELQEAMQGKIAQTARPTHISLENSSASGAPPSEELRELFSTFLALSPR